MVSEAQKIMKELRNKKIIDYVKDKEYVGLISNDQIIDEIDLFEPLKKSMMNGLYTFLFKDKSFISKRGDTYFYNDDVTFVNESKSFKDMIQDLVEGKSIINEAKTVKNDINKELQKWVHKNNFTLEDDFEEYIDEKLDDVIEGNLEGWFYSQFFMETAGTCFGRANGEDQSNYFDDAEDDLGRTLTDDEKYYLGQMIKYETMESLEWWYDKEEAHNVCVGWLATNYDVEINEKDFNGYKGRDKDFDYWEYYLDYLSEYHG